MIQIVPLQAFKDNYIWTLHSSTHAAVIESANTYLGARLADPVRVVAAIREWKKRF